MINYPAIGGRRYMITQPSAADGDDKLPSHRRQRVNDHTAIGGRVFLNYLAIGGRRYTMTQPLAAECTGFTQAIGGRG